MDKYLIRKDVYEDLIEKGFGKKDLSKLTKKQITDKNGHKRTVYVRNGEQTVTQNQPKAQDELSPEKKARYEEMLEKVVAGPEDNALFVKDKGMLNKKEAIAHLSEKLGKHADEAMKNANAKANNLTSMSKDDKIAILSEYMHQKYSSVPVEKWKKTYNDKLSDKELDEAFKDFSETHQNRIKEYQKKKPVNSAAQGHLESDTPQNTDITKEDEERFGKQALSGLSGKRTGNNDYEDLMARKKVEYADKVKKQGYDYQELRETGELPDGLSSKALREIRDKAKKDGSRNENTWQLYLDAQARLDEISRENYAKKQAKKAEEKPSQDDNKANLYSGKKYKNRIGGIIEIQDVDSDGNVTYKANGITKKESQKDFQETIDAFEYKDLDKEPDAYKKEEILRDAQRLAYDIQKQAEDSGLLR